jgi:hypothetical protein
MKLKKTKAQNPINKEKSACKKNLIIIFSIAFIITIFSCKKDNKCYDPTNPDCENYDPCHNAKMHSADFIIEHNIPDENDDWFWFKGDSVFSGGLLQFRSLEKGDIKHTWYVGAEVLHDSAVIRSFNTVTPPKFINIQHVIQYKPDSMCFPEDDGYDSVLRIFYMVLNPNDFLTTGVFRVVDEHSVDSYEFSCYAYYIDDTAKTQYSDGILYTNLVNNKSEKRKYSSIPTDTLMILRGHGGNADPKGRFTVNRYNLSVEGRITLGDVTHEISGRKIK